MITAERLRSVLSYDTESGTFSLPTFKNSIGYMRICVDGRRYLAHRVAWMYVHGVWPSSLIDHINGDRADNRLCNLRDVSQSVNQQNVTRPRKHGTSGFLGVTLCKSTGRWAARIRINGKKVSLGRFDTPERAYAAYVTAKRKHHEGNTL